MREKRSNLVLAILWTIVLIVNIIEYIRGTFEPTIFNMFVPLILLVSEYWLEYLDSLWGD